MGDAEREEQRQAPRVARSFMVRYRAAESGQTSWAVSPLRDLSHTGARFLSEQAFAVGTLLDVQLVLPTVKEPVSVQAKVARYKPGPLGLTEHGVMFETMDANSRQALEMAVTHFLTKGETP